MIFTRSKRLEVSEPSREALAGIDAAKSSLVEAQRASAKQEHSLRESRRIGQEIRAHNEANHYDLWLMGLVETKIKDRDRA